MRASTEYLVKTLFLVMCLVFGVPGCGGGTRGSGGQLYEGTVVDRSGAALANVDLVILATGDAARTDSAGSFSIQTDSLSGDVEFMLERRDFSGRAVTRGVPGDAVRIVVRFVVGEGQRPDIDVDTEVTDRRPTPTPAAVVPTRRPTPVVAPPSAPTPVPAPVVPTPSPSSTVDDDGDDDSDATDPSDDSDDDENG